MHDELYAAGRQDIVGYGYGGTPWPGGHPQYQRHVAGNLPHYAGSLPMYAAGRQEIVGYSSGYSAGYAAGAAAVQGVPDATPAGNAIAYGSAIGVSDRPPQKARLYPIGFVQLAVAASGTVTVTSRPQILFRPQRFVVPASLAANFVITDLRVGKDSQFAQATELPAEIFSQLAVGVMMTLDTAQISNDLAVTTRNTDAANPHDFRAVMLGATAE